MLHISNHLLQNLIITHNSKILYAGSVNTAFMFDLSDYTIAVLLPAGVYSNLLTKRIASFRYFEYSLLKDELEG